jgi:hypothetical protein
MSDPYFYHLFKMLGNATNHYKSLCDMYGNQCMNHTGNEEIAPGHKIFTYRKFVQIDELKRLLNTQIKTTDYNLPEDDISSRIINDLTNATNSVNSPYGYLRLNFDKLWPASSTKGFYLIIKTTSPEIPSLKDFDITLPYHVPTPQFFKKVGGSRRRTRSQKKRRRATRRRN